MCKRTLKPDKELLARGGTEVALTDFGMATLKLAGSLTRHAQGRRHARHQGARSV